ncbi:MAG: lysophospholipid acyltransferase family protein [Bacteroidales bacterium]
MKFIGYIFVYSITWVFHILPDRALYLFSDFLYLIAYHVVRYRKQVVFGNLTRAFPAYGHREVEEVARKYYHHLCDLLLESAVFLFYSKKRALKKISYRNQELLEDLFKKGKQVIGVTAHYGNWEYLATLGLLTDYRILAAYKPLKNKYFDRFIRKSRKKFGVIPIPMEKIARRMMTYGREKDPTMAIFLSDQRPLKSHIQYWTRFMGMDTPLYLGAEKLSRKLGAAVIFIKISKAKRGHYEVEYELICESPPEMEPHMITESHVRILEEVIRERPELWLWSHRRWKYSKPRPAG